MSPTPNCLSLAQSQKCSQWRAYSVEIQANTPFTDIAGFDTFIRSHENPNNVTDFRSFYGCDGWSGTGIRYQTTTFCGMLVWAATQTCNSVNGGIPITTCRSSVQSFVDSTRSLFNNPSICSASPTPDQEAARTVLISTASQFANSLPADDPASGVAPTEACIIANSDVPGELQACGFYDAQEALTFCAANPRQFCCSAVPGFTAPASLSLASSTTTTAATSAAITSRSTTTSRTVSRSATTSSTLAAAAAPTPAAPPPAVPSTNSTAANASTSSGTTSTQTIFGLAPPVFIGAVVGGTVVIIALIVGLVLCTRRRRTGAVEAAVDPSAAKAAASVGARGSFPRSGSGAGMSPVAAAPAPADFNPYSQASRAERGFDAPSATLPSPGGMNGEQYAMQPMGGMQDMGMGAMGMGMGMGGGRQPLPGQDPNGETMEAVFNYVPNLSDEIYLYVGDPVLVSCQFDDGWGYGVNLTTQQEGAFPLACVAPYNPNGDGRRMTLGGEEVVAGPDGVYVGGGVGLATRSADPARASFSIRQRQSSMFGPPAGFRETMMTEVQGGMMR
ncbi:hypothetical protein HDU96_004140 [Phlyctochytrium bullatum]|nr:hypothetical protein HDU96_004140 [Phlyctochytrium bullatum]